MDCDILHLHHPKYLIFTKHIKAKKIVLTHHGYYKNPYSCDYKFSETYVSHFLKDFTNNTQGYVVYNPIPMIEYPLTQNKKREYLFFIGACDKKVKRLDIAIEVAEKSNHKLIVAGTASQSLKSYLSTLAFVEYIGEVNQTEKLKLFSKSKAVICPNDSPEAFCLVAAEANAVGIPVIASNNGGLPEVIGNNISGYICYSLNDYLNAITKVNTLNVNKVRNYTKSKFDISIISNDYLSLFNQLLNEK
ncbi:MAG: glycosyltransferase [Saprospiraceae bacterium]|nr:glycosyltransferase [Saprospiraceae bacterium]